MQNDLSYLNAWSEAFSQLLSIPAAFAQEDDIGLQLS